MFTQIFLFELNYWLKRPITYIFFSVFFGLAMLVVAAQGGLIGDAADSGAIINSAKAITGVLSGLNTNLIGVIILIAIIAPAVYKDFQYNTHPLFFTKPITKFGYLYGRFFAAIVIALFVLSSTVIAHIIACSFPGIEPELLGKFNISNYIQPFLFFVIPNTLFIGAIFFSLATFSRNMLAAYIGAIVLMILKGISPRIMGNIDNETVSAMIDPFGEQAIKITIKYWTTEEQNTLPLQFNGVILYNRLLWIAISLVISIGTFFKFKFSQFSNPVGFSFFKKKEEQKAIVSAPVLSIDDIPKANQLFTWKNSLAQSLFLAKFEFLRIVKSIFFAIIVAISILTLTLSSAVFGQIYGTPTYLVTYQILDTAETIFFLFVNTLIIFYSGMLVWKERDLKVDELVGTTPLASWVSFGSKLLALVYMQIALLLVIMITGIFIQLYDGYYEIDVLLYFKELFGFKLIGLILVCVLTLFIQTIFNQKFLGYFVSALVIVVFPLVAVFLKWDNALIFFNSSGVNEPYSDMNGYGNAVYPFLIHKSYWIGFCIMLVVLSNLFLVRGKEKGFKKRIQIAKQLFNSGAKWSIALGLIIFIGFGSFIYYNNSVLNKNISANAYEKLQADFEKKYKKYSATPQPRIVSANWNVDIFPEQRGAKMKGYYILKNKNKKNVDSIAINFNPDIQTELKLSKPSTLVIDDKENGFYVYMLSVPLLPGDSIQLDMSMEYFPKGFKASSVRANATFFNSSILPSIGYSSRAELTDNDDRKEHGLQPKEKMPLVSDSVARMNNYISSDADWINFECIVSTTANQIAIAPGYIQKKWEQDGRKYFHYKMDSKIFNFYSFLSARYEVKKDKWKDSLTGKEIAIEIYYHKGHEYNIDRMIKSVQKSLDYYTKNFSPYQHRQVRIIEFSRVDGNFAQSFPNTIPFSEGVGFIAKMDKNDPESIDYTFYITAHEVAHQWWAHQVIGGNVQGATLLSETMSQYSSLMVMEKEYGKQAMRKFLKYEMDKYLKTRTFDSKKEKALMYVEPDQTHIHYQKGSVIMYALKDYIGEDSLNAALRKYISKVGFQEPPYTNSVEFVSYLRAATPDSLKYIINDMFESITLYENKVSQCLYSKTKDGKYLVKINVESKKTKADSLGKMKDVPINDWIDIAVFGEKNNNGKKTETELYFQKRKIDKNKMEFEIIVDDEPVKAGIDPYNKLVDRTPDNNTKSLKGNNKSNSEEGSESSVSIKVGK